MQTSQEPLPGGEPAASHADPPEIRWLRRGLWALLLMVLVGLLAVWLVAGGAESEWDRLPVLAELPAFSLTATDGATVTRESLAGRPWVAGFLFTRCGISCPRLLARMKSLGEHLPPRVARVAVTVDPEHDTPETLAAWARASGVEPGPDWLFLTGPGEEVRELVVGGFKLGLAATPPELPQAAVEPITHSTRLVLVDGRGRIRGYYDAFDEASMRELLTAARHLARRR